MAEIGLVAAIFGLASFGTKVATSLYEAADDMIHADQQITSMAKHVSQFTAVLRHLGRVLESEQGNCSKDLLREIRKIKHSCKATFKEINATIRSRRLRSFVPVRWLFKKSKAKELEARLDSEQSILQVMIHTVTVAKLGDMQSKSKEDSKQITGLREEIDLLKTLIIENYINATVLQRAEQRTEAEAGHNPFPGYDIHRGPQPPYDFQEPPQHDRLSRSNMNDIPPPRSLSAGSSLSEPENEDRGPDKTAGSTRDIPPRNPSHSECADSSDDDAHPTNTYQESALQPRPEYKGTLASAKTRTSTLLLEMVPFEPRTSDTAYYHRSNHLISAGPSEPARLSTNPKPAMEEATKSVRLLLDKWTNSGSAPFASLLIEESAKHPPDEELTDRNRRREPGCPPSPPPPLMGNMSDDEDNIPFYRPSVDPFPYAPGGYMPPPPPHRTWHSIPKPAPWVPPFGISDIRTKDVWKPFHAYGQVPSSYIGADILNALRHERGGIVYTKRDDFQQVLYVDEVPFYKFSLVPISLAPSVSEILATEIGKGWVRQEALDLLSYSYSETPSGHFSISGNLDFSEIEELVRISYQALCRGLEERSRQIIKERGWHERVAASHHETQIHEYRSRPPRYPEPWTQPYAPYPGEHAFYRSRSRDRNRPSSPTPPRTGANAGPLQRAPLSNADSESRQLIRAERTTTEGGKSVVAVTPTPEVRFTLPHMESAQHTRSAGAPPPPPNPKPADKPAVIVGRKGKLELEIQEATEKLSLLQKRRDEAARTKDHTLKSDLEYYAIPDMKARIEKLKHELNPWVDDYQKKRDDEKRMATASASANTEAEKRQTRHNAEMQTDSESSSEEDEPDESEAIMDIYD